MQHRVGTRVYEEYLSVVVRCEKRQRVRAGDGGASRRSLCVHPAGASFRFTKRTAFLEPLWAVRRVPLEDTGTRSGGSTPSGANADGGDGTSNQRKRALSDGCSMELENFAKVAGAFCARLSTSSSDTEVVQLFRSEAAPVEVGIPVLYNPSAIEAGDELTFACKMAPKKRARQAAVKMSMKEVRTHVESNK